ncbi:MAG: patatin-like phospholipase family protein [Acidimicrobiales bacterium]
MSCAWYGSAEPGGPAAAPATAFVLGGASNLGAMQVGMLEALLERGVVPDVVVGCSAGALNGAAVALEPTLAGVHRLARLWLALTRADVWPTRPLITPLQLLRRRGAVNTNDGLRRVIESYVPPETTFADLALPFACVATSLDTGRERWFTEGPLARAILASAALPALFPPVEVDGEALIDGATVNVVPIGKALELGATRLFLLQVRDVDAEPVRPRRPLDVLLRALAIARNSRFAHELASLPAGVEVHVLPVVSWPRLRYDGFSRTPQLIEGSRVAAHRYLEALHIGA